MNRNIYEEARDFAGEDWEKMSIDGRKKMLVGYGCSPSLSSLKWRRLPESVRMSLIMPMVIEKKELNVRFNKRNKKRA